MPTVVVRHKVGDFGVWLKGHEDRVRLFAPAVSSFRTFQDQNDPKNQAIKERHTVKEPFIISNPVAV